MRRLLLVPLSLGALALSGCDPSTTLPLGQVIDQPDAPTVYTPSSIDATGQTDVSAAFASFLASVPDGSVIELAPNGKYRMEVPLWITDRHDLTFEGNGATFFATTRGDRNRGNVHVRLGSDITFRNLTVKGANPDAGKDGKFEVDLEAQHAFDTGGVKNFTLDNVTATDVYGDFVHLSRWGDTLTDGVTIKNSHFERSGRQGIAFFAVRNVVVENNVFTDLRRATFDFEPGGGVYGVENVVVRNNQIGPGRLNFIAAAGHGPVNNITIAGNQLSGQALQVFLIDKSGGRRSNWKILNNTSDLTVNNPHKSVMRIWRVDGLEIRGNYQRFSKDAGMYLASVDSSCDVEVSGNHLPNAVGQANITGTCPAVAATK